MIFNPVLGWWFVGIVFIPLVLYSAYRLVFSRNNRPNEVKKSRHMWLRRLLFVSILLVIAIRPAIPGASVESGKSLLDVYFVVDTTLSMSAEDYNGELQRIEGAKSDIKAIVTALSGARFSIVSSDTSVVQTLPLSNDPSAASSSADTLAPVASYNSHPSDIATSASFMKTELERVAKEAPDRGRILIYLGDGEQTDDSEPKSFESITPLLSGAIVLGYGTESGGRMRQTAYSDDALVKYIKYYDKETYESSDARSVIDENNLQEIATQLNGTYEHRSEPGSVEPLLKTIDTSAIIKDSSQVESYHQTYWAFAPLLIVLCIWEIIPLLVLRRKVRHYEKEVIS